MTETTGASAGAQSGSDKSTDTKKTSHNKGVKVERIFTTPGVHPYDEVTWEHRDVVQQNWKTGATIFEQRDVEFPDFWSVNASTIVTTKYFRGAVGTPSSSSTASFSPM
jgi:ribonucleoside-diphosphate reductase alpha chain